MSAVLVHRDDDVDALLLENLDGLPGSIVLGHLNGSPASIGIFDLTNCRKHTSSISFHTRNYAIDGKDALNTEMVQVGPT